MSSVSSDEYVPATPESTPPKLIQPRMFKYFTPGNSPVSSREIPRLNLSIPTPSPSPASFVAETPQIGRAPNAPFKSSFRVDGAPSPAARKKLPFTPRRHKTRSPKIDFKNSLYKVLRKIDPKGTISSKAMDVLNDMMRDMLDRLADEAASIREKNGHTTLRARDIQTAARLLFPGSLFTHAFYEGHGALVRVANANF